MTHLPKMPGDGVGWVGPLTVKLSPRNEQLCKLIERKEQASTPEEFLQLASEFASIRAFALATACQRRAK